MIDLLKILGLMLVPVAIGILVWIVVKFWRLLRSLEGAHDPDELLDKGRCGECGYDLRSGHLVCPECGTPVPTEEERAAARGTQLNPIALRDDWAEASKLPRTPSPLELPTVVFSTVNNLEANLLVDQLNDRGVLASISRKEEYQVGATVQRIDHLHVVVPSGDKLLAESIIDRFRWKPTAVQTSANETPV